MSDYEKLRDSAADAGNARTNYVRHGFKGTKIYKVWENMKSRCLNQKNTAYKNYGGRGITLSERWIRFTNFLEDMGIPPEGMTLDRIDNDLGYFKENCRWASHTTQGHNRRFHKRNGKKTSKYRGVFKKVGYEYYVARIQFHDEEIYLHGKLSEIEAAEAYDFCAIMLYGEAAITNFNYGEPKWAELTEGVKGE